MLVRRKHPFTGKMNALELDVTREQIDEYSRGAMAQDAFPNLTPDEREFIITGLMPGEFDELMQEE